MPDWWETAYGTDPHTPDNNGDLDGNHYTNLEEYLNWMAEPHFSIQGPAQVDVAPYFRGYTHPAFTLEGVPEGATAVVEGAHLTVTPAATPALITVRVKAWQGDVSLVRSFHFYVSPGAANQ